MSIGLCSTFDITAFAQNRHHLYSSSSGGQDPSNDIHFRVIGSIEPEICTKMLRNLVRTSHLNDAFSGFLELEASPVEG